MLGGMTVTAGRAESDVLARRRAAVVALRVASAVCAYAAERLGDSRIPPAEARAAAKAAAADLAVLAQELRRLARTAPAPRPG
jgi:hypothetical protein